MKAITYKEFYLPTFRENQGLSDNEVYLQSAVEQINHLSEYFDFYESSSILDFGCGQGRLVNGLKLMRTQFGSYFGVDTHYKSIKWCNKWITKYGTKIKFIHLPAFNARYNRGVETLQQLPFEKNSFDLVFLNSVFSHMLTDDVLFYIEEFQAVLKANGILYVTAFVEEKVPDCEENPKNYLGESVGKLHRVRFEKQFFLNLFEENGFKVEIFAPQHISRTKQSVIIARKI
ncbi:class I SAM-dependent methyltransferase [Aureitalea sp. L0-47]|uniref:class I SAM-dependent methyltransferase n=1 Tax=Aureitalea sp. L0-47 TaxID=2816962 RepID=UPI002237588E|nr:class I SAM-dependent methyltransferase [Aureitalea sp. L0-47]